MVVESFIFFSSAVPWSSSSPVGIVFESGGCCIGLHLNYKVLFQLVFAFSESSSSSSFALFSVKSLSTSVVVSFTSCSKWPSCIQCLLLLRHC